MQVMGLFKAGLSSGTWHNKVHQVAKYLRFTTGNKINPLCPSQYQVMGYIAHLSQVLRSPGAVLNYASGARTWIRTMGGSTDGFDTYPVMLVRRGVMRASNHQPSQALPLSVSDVQGIVRFFRSSGRIAYVLVAATLIGFVSVLRQSNLLTSGHRRDAGHALTAGEVLDVGNALHLRVRSTKTSQGIRNAFTIVLPEIPMSSCCPVRAWRKYKRVTSIADSDPAFLMLNGNALSINTLTAAIRLALTYNHHPSPSDVTLHSLRRGAAQSCARAGADVNQVAESGGWRSSAVFTYVPKRLFTAAPLTLSSLFAGGLKSRLYK